MDHDGEKARKRRRDVRRHFSPDRSSSFVSGHELIWQRNRRIFVVIYEDVFVSYGIRVNSFNEFPPGWLGEIATFRGVNSLGGFLLSFPTKFRLAILAYFRFSGRWIFSWWLFFMERVNRFYSHYYFHVIHCYLYKKVNADCLNDASRRIDLGIGHTIVGRVQALSG